MSNYYLPIKINDRRNFVCNLSDSDIIEPKFSFIVDITQGCTLLSIDKNAVIISGRKAENNKQIEDCNIYIQRLSNEEDSSWLKREDNEPVYVLEIVNRGNGRTEEKPDGLFVDETSDSVVSLMLNVTEFGRDKKSFILLVKNDEFRHAIRFYTYFSEKVKIVSAALDFGSEASQVRMSGNNYNTRLVETFAQISGMNQDDNYYQGCKDDNLFKSILYINRRPYKGAKFGEKPMCYGTDTFVQTLLSKEARREDLEELSILPNLKLVEFAISGAEDIFGMGQEIKFPPENREVAAGNPPTLGNVEQRENILRLIIGNFIHAIMYNIKEDCLLQLVLMAPNVYYQSKVHKLMEDAYKDFYIMQPDYNHIKGIEVQVLSESDASFLGIKTKYKNLLKNRRHAYSLIIDAGKGTTDFSILKQGENFSEYESVYRYGIPASGHVITYSFYDALFNFFKQSDIQLDNLLKDAAQKQKTEFLDCLDLLKIKYEEYKNVMPDEKPNKDKIRNLDDVITYVKEVFIDKGVQLPQIDSYLDKNNEETNIFKLKNLLEQALEKYTHNNKIKFLNVILTGRGFLFKPFRDAVKEMLINNGMCSEDSVSFLDGEAAKTICMDGALSLGRTGDINKNSGLVGTPEFTEDTSEKLSGFRNFIRKIWNQLNGFSKNDIYTVGYPINAQNVKLFISGREYDINFDERTNVNLFYIGNGFLWQTDDNAKVIPEMNFASIYKNVKINNLIYQSLFPYYGLDKDLHANIDVDNGDTQEIEEMDNEEDAYVNMEEETVEEQTVADDDINR